MAATAPPLRFELLGGFAVRRGTWTVPDQDWERPSAARLVRFLLVNRPEPVPADLIAEALWRDLEPERAKGSVQVAVSRARRALDLPGAERSVIESIDSAYRLRLGDRDEVDAEQFERAAQAALAAAGERRLALLERARALWGGLPLPAERYDEWTLGWRERLVDRCVELLSELIGSYAERGDHAAAITAGRELIDLDPLNEAAHRRLIAAYARAGRTGQALRQYLECRRRLVGELGVEPSEATSRLQARILAGEAV